MNHTRISNPRTMANRRQYRSVTAYLLVESLATALIPHAQSTSPKAPTTPTSTLATRILSGVSVQSSRHIVQWFEADGEQNSPTQGQPSLLSRLSKGTLKTTR